MALLTDIIIASPTEADAVAACLRPATQWPCLELKGLNNAVLADLLAALGAEAEASSLAGTQWLICMPRKEGPWVFHLPDVLVSLLADVEDRDIPELARRWAQGEELAYDGLEGPHVEPDIRRLRDFAKRAVAADKPLLLRMCL